MGKQAVQQHPSRSYHFIADEIQVHQFFEKIEASLTYLSACQSMLESSLATLTETQFDSSQSDSWDDSGFTMKLRKLIFESKVCYSLLERNYMIARVDLPPFQFLQQSCNDVHDALMCCQAVVTAWLEASLNKLASKSGKSTRRKKHGPADLSRFPIGQDDWDILKQRILRERSILIRDIQHDGADPWIHVPSSNLRGEKASHHRWAKQGSSTALVFKRINRGLYAVRRSQLKRFLKRDALEQYL